MIAALSLLAAYPAAGQAPAPYADLPGTSWIMIEWNSAAPSTPFPPVASFSREFHFGGDDILAAHAENGAAIFHFRRARPGEKN